MYKVVQIWPGQTVTCLHTISPGHIWTTLYVKTQHWGRVRVTILAVKKSTKYYMFWMFVCSHSYPTCKAHAPFNIVICGLSGSAIFFNIMLYDFLIKKKSYWTQNMFWFSLQLSSETFLIPRIIQRYHKYTHVFMWSIRYFSHFTETWILTTYFRKKKPQRLNFIKSVQQELRCFMRMDEQTDRYNRQS